MINEWWDSLTFLAQCYWVVAVCGSTLMLIMLFLSLFNLDGDGDMDMDGPAEHPSGLGLLSTRAISSFLMGFGWAGVICYEQEVNDGLSIVIATIGGSIWLWIILKLMQFLFSLKHDGTVRFENAVGSTAQVYIPIPAKLQGNGQVQLTVQGRFRVVDAVTRHTDQLDRRLRVRVTEILDQGTLVVEPDVNPEE